MWCIVHHFAPTLYCFPGRGRHLSDPPGLPRRYPQARPHPCHHGGHGPHTPYVWSAAARMFESCSSIWQMKSKACPGVTGDPAAPSRESNCSASCKTSYAAASTVLARSAEPHKGLKSKTSLMIDKENPRLFKVSIPLIANDSVPDGPNIPMVGLQSRQERRTVLNAYIGQRNR